MNQPSEANKNSPSLISIISQIIYVVLDNGKSSVTFILLVVKMHDDYPPTKALSKLLCSIHIQTSKLWIPRTVLSPVGINAGCGICMLARACW